MAHMIPSMGPARGTVAASKEAEIYDSLSRLSDDFYVIHSLRFNKVKGLHEEEREADFVIFSKNLGILVIEAKAGQVCCHEGEWRYGNGAPMSHGGPFLQALSMRIKIIDLFTTSGLGALKPKCRITTAVWFPSIDSNKTAFVDQCADGDRAKTLCRNDLNNPQSAIERIMRIGSDYHKTRLTNEEAQQILDRILFPTFHVVPTASLDSDYRDFLFSRLLDSQIHVLDFLQDQKTAVINGAAGTGKTLVAIEYAKRKAVHENVLFLCYNSLLRDDIEKRCEDYPNISVYTIDGFATKIARGSHPSADFDELYKPMVDIISSDRSKFPYKHVIIDEGQDFGTRSIADAEVLETLQLLIEEDEGATMFLFYDMRQFVQGSNMPSFIRKADSKVTLYTNCRNTHRIAQSSLSSIGEAENKRDEVPGVEGDAPKIRISPSRDELIRFVDDQIAVARAAGMETVAILTCKSIQSSIYADCFTSPPHATTAADKLWRKTSIPVYTFRRFKGLESDAVILIDVDESLWKEPETPFDPEPGTAFYTASSRAKSMLSIACHMDDEGIRRTIRAMGSECKRKPVAQLRNLLHANPA